MLDREWRLYTQFVDNTAKVEVEKLPYLAAMGLAGEAGEVVEIMKKHLLHGKELDESKLIDEMGDVLWYFTLLMNIYNIRLEEILYLNQLKLEKRHSQTPEHYGVLRTEKEG